ncbi:MAG: peptidylprolyl isomerase [Planctomycetota bacterium]|nr:peptidylprolyl isomerase [Planctomycetota bacterium]
MRRILKEPLLHFLVFGAALFLAYGLLQRNGGSREPGQIVVTLGQIEQMAAGFAKTWQRPPTTEELAGLVRDRVREEVYCREAMALGLDREDTVIRRRLRQKMEFVSDDVAALAEPTEAELEEYLRTHADAFRVEPRFTFNQVYLDPQKHGADLASDAAKLRAQLEHAGAGADLSTLGDSRMLEPQYTDLPLGDVAQQFGEPFSKALDGLAVGRWQGPVESGYGVHLVYVRERAEGHTPVLSDVREAVRREWDNARRIAANEAFYTELLKSYTVQIEGLDDTGKAK